MQTLAIIFAVLLLAMLARSIQLQEKIMADTSKLEVASSKFAADFSTLAIILAANPPADPAQQAKVDAITQQLTDMDASAQAIDASLKPPAGGGMQP